MAGEVQKVGCDCQAYLHHLAVVCPPHLGTLGYLAKYIFGASKGCKLYWDMGVNYTEALKILDRGDVSSPDFQTWLLETVLFWLHVLSTDFIRGSLVSNLQRY